MGDLHELGGALAELHRTLIHLEAGGDPALKNPYALLNALMNDPKFGWLREISGVMATLDEMEDKGEVDLAACRGMVEKVIGPAGWASEEFRRKFEEAVAGNAHVAAELGKVRVALGKLPG